MTETIKHHQHPWLTTARHRPWRLLLVPAFLAVSWWGGRPLPGPH